MWREKKYYSEKGAYRELREKKRMKGVRETEYERERQAGRESLIGD